MNLNCNRNIINDGLAIDIDITDSKCWLFDPNLTLKSNIKWNESIVDDINLYDFGLTGVDNGRVNNLTDNLLVTSDDYLKLYRVGYNDFSGNTIYSGYSLNFITGNTTIGDYINLNGGYFQGFFKLQGKNYELLPFRYNNGITIETLITINDDSSGIFYLMGLRADDKYNPYFSGETEIITTTQTETINTGLIGSSTTIETTTTGFTGVFTSENNYLMSYSETNQLKKAFIDFADKTEVKHRTVEPIDNIKNNVIAFALTNDKKIQYKYIDGNGILISNVSKNIITTTGQTLITITFNPYNIIDNYVYANARCYNRRKGDLNININGRLFWKIKDFDEFYFNDITNDNEKTFGASYNISWGGGSFGLKHSHNFDYKNEYIYSGNSTQYINNNFEVIDYLFNENICITGTTDYTSLTLMGNDDLFYIDDVCDPNILTPVTVMELSQTGITGSSNFTELYIENVNSLEIISNREYEVFLDIYDIGMFQRYNNNNYPSNSKISLIVYGTEDISIINRVDYTIPRIIDNTSGLNKWNQISVKFKLNNNTNKQNILIGVLIESDIEFNSNFNLYMKDFYYRGQDNIVHDNNKDNLYIEKYFDSSYIGDIQKLRIYTRALDSSEILHNAMYENNLNNNMNITKGGRIIYR